MIIFKYFVLLIFLISNSYSQSKETFSFGISISDYSIAEQNRIKNLSLGLQRKLNEENLINVNIFKSHPIIKYLFSRLHQKKPLLKRLIKTKLIKLIQNALKKTRNINNNFC